MSVVRPMTVAELSVNHLGMKKIALCMLEKCRDLGVDYVKFKAKDVSSYYRKGQPSFRGYRFGTYRGSLELSQDDFREIDAWCQQNGVKWFSTVHDLPSLDFVSSFDVPFLKIASMDAQKRDFLDAVIRANSRSVPLVISLGGVDLEKTEWIVESVKRAGMPLILLHTVSIYPTPVEKCNIQYIKRLRDRFLSESVQIGYSGHERGWLPTLWAVQAGATMIERHFTLSRNLKIHHIEASLLPREWEQMNKDIDSLVSMMNAEHVSFFDEEMQFLDDRKYT